MLYADSPLFAEGASVRSHGVGKLLYGRDCDGTPTPPPTPAAMCEVWHMDADLEQQEDVWLPEQAQRMGRETADGRGIPFGVMGMV